MEPLQNVDLDLRDLMGVVVEHLSDSDTSSDEDRGESESEVECEKKKEDFLSPSRKAASPRNSSRRPRSRRPQATQKDEGMARKFPSLGVTFQADVPPFTGTRDGASCHENASSEGSRRVWSLDYIAPVKPSPCLSPTIAHTPAKAVSLITSGSSESHEVNSSQPTFDELSIPCYWTLDSQSQSSQSQSYTAPSNGTQTATASATLRSVSDDDAVALEALVDRTLYAAMLAQYLPGMVVTYIRGAEGEGKVPGAEAGSLGTLKPREEREKDKDKERERGDDSLHGNRSSKRISMVSGVGVKSARFGCIIKGPFFPNVTSISTSTSDPSERSAAMDTEVEAPSSSSASTPITTAEGRQIPQCLRQPMMTLFTGVTDEVEYISLSSCCIISYWVVLSCAKYVSILTVCEEYHIISYITFHRLTCNPLTKMSHQVVTVPCFSCCRVVPDDEVLYLLSETKHSFDTVSD
jgi:hypothetical protein